MITPAFVRTLAAYNSEMNRRLYGPAARLSDTQRREERGAFWGSLQATLAHILWADRMWMSRFAGWEKPAGPLKQSAQWEQDFSALAAARVETDAGIERWASEVTQAWLDERLTWFSGAANRESARRAAFSSRISSIIRRIIAARRMRSSPLWASAPRTPISSSSCRR